MEPAAQPPTNAPTAGESQINPKEWKEVAEKYKDSTDPVECAEALMKGRLYFLTLSIAEKEAFYKTLAKIYRNYFNSVRENMTADEKLDLIETFEEGVEDWAGLNDALDTFIGLKEPDDAKKTRLSGCEARGKEMFDKLPNFVARAFLERIGEPAFEEFLKREFGNTEIINYLKDNKEMELAREALIDEDKTNPFFGEMTTILKGILGGNAGPKDSAMPENVINATNSSSPIVEEFAKTVEEFKQKKDPSTIIEYIKGAPLGKFPKSNTNDLATLKAELKKYADSLTEKDEIIAQILSRWPE